MDFKLEVNGAVVQPLHLSLDDLRQQYPAHTVSIQFSTDEHTVNGTFTGVRLWDLLQSAGIKPASPDNLRVIARATDQFRCRLLWNEVDPSVSERVILVAYEQDGKPLVTKEGPLRLIVPGDERGVRYLRGLALLTVLDRSKEQDEEEE